MANFSKDDIQNVWNKAFIVNGYNPNLWRKDQCGAWIGRKYYGDRDCEYGWEIDHITPVSHDGTDSLYNLRPLQWENNASRQNGRLACKVTASGVHNVLKK